MNTIARVLRPSGILVIFLLAASTLRAAEPIARWDFEGEQLPLGATLVNARIVEEGSGHCLSVVPKNSFLSIPSRGEFNLAAPVSFSFWAKQPARDAGVQAVIMKASGDQRQVSFALRIRDNGRIEFAYRDTQGRDHRYDTERKALPRNFWSCVVISWPGPGKGPTVYIDARAVDGSWHEGDGSGAPAANDMPLTIGGFATDPDFPAGFAGLLDDVAFYRVALRAEEVVLMYERSRLPYDERSKPEVIETGAKGNLLSNGSFEVGITGSEWGVHWAWEEPWGPFSLPHWDSTAAAVGKYSWRTKSFERYVKLEPNTKYTLSLYLRGTEPGSQATVSVFSGWARDFPASRELLVERSFALSSEWKRYWLSFVATPPKGSDGWPYFWIELSSRKTLWVDGIQLEHGGLTDYADAHPVEVGCGTLTPGNLFDRGQRVQLRVTAYARPAQKAAVTPVELVVYDFRDRVVAAEDLRLALDASRHGETIVDLSLPRTGWWRAQVSCGSARSEALIARLPKPYTVPLQEARFGTENYGMSPQEVAVTQRLGLRWYRKFLLWRQVEPGEGQALKLDYYLPQFRAVQRAGMGLCIVFVSPPDWVLAKGRDGVLPLPEQTAAFLGRLERAGVHPEAWEVWNEFQSRPEDAKSYVAQVRAATEKLRELGSKAKVVGALTSVHGDPDTWAWNEAVIRAGLLKECDVLAFHGYLWPQAATAVYPEASIPPFSERVTRLRKLMDENGGRDTPLWDTETGILGRSAYSLHEDYVQRYECYEAPYPTAREQARRYAQSFAVELASGVSRICQYMSGWGLIGVHREIQSSLFEPSMEPRPSALAIAACASELEGARPAGSWEPSPLIRAWLFERDGGTTCVLWAHEAEKRPLTMILRTPHLERLVDMCGTEWPVSLLAKGLDLDGDVWYVILSGSSAQVRQSLRQAVLVPKQGGAGG